MEDTKKNNEAWSGGPWERKSPIRELRNSHEILASNGGLVCRVPMVSILHEANARLISVAPELVEGIEAFRVHMESWISLEGKTAPDRVLRNVLADFNAAFQPLLDRARGGG